MTNSPQSVQDAISYKSHKAHNELKQNMLHFLSRAPGLFSIVGELITLGPDAEIARKMEHDVKVFIRLKRHLLKDYLFEVNVQTSNTKTWKYVIAITYWVNKDFSIQFMTVDLVFYLNVAKLQENISEDLMDFVAFLNVIRIFSNWKTKGN